MTSRFAPTLDELKVRKPRRRALSEEETEMTKRQDKKARSKAKAKDTRPASPTPGRAVLSDEERRHRAVERSKRWYADPANAEKVKAIRARSRAKRIEMLASAKAKEAPKARQHSAKTEPEPTRPKSSRKASPPRDERGRYIKAS